MKSLQEKLLNVLLVLGDGGEVVESYDIVRPESDALLQTWKHYTVVRPIIGKHI